jgi:TonB-linked SusC/RagA family outer membrane protein
MKKYGIKSVFLVVLLLFSQFAIGQESLTVTGKVTDASDGTGIPGVSIVVDGTTNGVISDVDGNYTITTERGETLVFSFIGMVTVREPVNRAVINISMEPDLYNLAEVVVTGLAGATNKKKLTFSLESIDAEIINRAPSLNVASALSGKVAGMKIATDDSPGGGVEMLLRGATSLRTGNGPLVVIDGILTDGTIRDINIQDVANIEILKGASAASLYGSRAANGVIAIYTKRGLDNAIGETKIRVKSEYGFESVYKSRMPEKITHHPFQLNPDGSFVLDASGWAVPDVENIWDNPFPVTYDHMDMFFTGSPYSTNYIEISNRSQTSNVLFSAEYANRQAAMELHDGNQRINLRLNADQYLGDKFKISTSVLLVQQKFDLSPVEMDNLLLADPSDNYLLPNADGSPYNVAGNKFVQPFTYMNPLYYLANVDDSKFRHRVLGSFDLTYFINKNLSFESRYGLDYNTDVNRSFRNAGFLAVNEGTYENGRIGRSWSDSQAVTATQTLNYFKTFGTSLNVKARLFYQYESEIDHSFGMDADSLGVVKGWDNFDAVPQASRRIITGYSSDPHEITGHNFALASSFDYRDKYILDFVVRREGISLFGPEERWQTFGRVSGAYRLTEDIDIPQVQELSLRASYGTAGGRPLFLDQYEYAVVNDGIPYPPTQKKNPAIKPNKTSELELSVRVDFLNRFNFLASYSMQENRDQILRLSLSAASGYSSIVTNAGTLSTNSLEFSLGYSAIQRSDINLNFNLIMDKTNQTITEFEPTPYFDGLQWIKEGNSLTAMYGQKFATKLSEVANQLPVGEVLEDYFTINGQGFVIVAGTEFTNTEKVIRILDDDGVPINTFKIGDSAPDLSFGLNTDFRYKSLSFNMLWGAQIGGNVYNRGLQRMVQHGLAGILDQSEYPEGERRHGAYYASIYNAIEYVDYYVHDASFVKLREASVSYNISEESLINFGVGKYLKNIRVSALGKNLLVLSKYSGFDPETGNINNREDYFEYPLVRSFTGSIEFTF